MFSLDMKTHIDKLILEPFQLLGETLSGTFDCNPFVKTLQ